MNIVVCIKRVVDVSQVKVDERTKEPIIKGIAQKTSDFDKNAVEAAIKTKEKLGGTITAITVGEASSAENIKEALAMGADKGVILSDPSYVNLDSHNVSKVLAQGIKSLGQVDLVLLGEASIDSYSGQMVSRLAELLGFGQMTAVRAIKAEKDKMVCEKDMGATVRELEGAYPLVISVTKEVNEPRLPTLMQILGAGRKPLETKGAPAIGLDVSTISPGIEMKGLKAITMQRKKVLFEGDEAPGQLATEIKNFLGR